MNQKTSGGSGRAPGDRTGRGPARRSSTRVQRFSEVYGWRAYAVPVLVIATFFALVGVVRNVEASDAATGPGNQIIAAANTPGARSSAVPTENASGSADATGPPDVSGPPDVTGPPSATVSPSSTVDPTSQAQTSTAKPTKTADAQGEQLDPSAAPITDYVENGDNNLNVVAGKSGVLGSGGPVKRFAVEVEGGLKVDAVAFAKAVEAILGDPRSWGATKTVRFQRVSSGQIDFRVALVSPAHVESRCPGYGTGGYTSCRYQDRAVINLARWSVGVPFYAGHLGEYRQMVINHEVGHWLGHGHEKCSGAGKLAPVMQQQTLSMQGCKINAWPYPHDPSDNPANPN